MCTCTEPFRSGIGAVCVEYGRPKWPTTMLHHTSIPGTEKCVCVCFFFLAPAPYARTTRYERGCFFFLGKPRKKRLASLARLIIILQSINDTLVFSLSLRRHVSLFPFLSSSLYNSLPWHTLEIPYSSSMLNPHVIGRGAPFTSRLPLVACWSLRAS